ncbi:MAG TPA: M48 family metallopeptidase [Candidatus Binatia bacterium]|nr:M48 family metallopeptidase [Candidatus Binatia bacterium]
MKLSVGGGRLPAKYRLCLRVALAMLFLVPWVLSACITAAAPPSERAPQTYSQARPQSYAPRGLDSSDSERLRRVMVPLVQAMNKPCRLDQTKVGIINQDEINAANAGKCQFYVTVGLLRRASDNQLRGVLAHELAHQDLGHVAKAQVLGATINALSAGLQQLSPIAGVVAPIAGELAARSYGRNEEFNADKHGVEILGRAGYSKEVMVDSLSWIRRISGDKGGGFLSTHPGLDDRIATIQRLR